MADEIREAGPPQDDLVDALKKYDRDQSAAWQVFTRQFDRENPTPPAPKVWHWLPYAMLPFGVLGGAGAFLSALRTAPVFAYVAQQFSQVAATRLDEGLTNGEGLIATFVVDGAAIAFRFAMVVYNTRPGASQEVSKWVNRGFWFAFMAQIIANLYGTMGVATALGENVKQAAELAIMIVAALSGIIIAFATGDILGHQWLGAQSKRAQLQETYEARVAERDEKKKGAWGRKKGGLGVREPVDVSANVRERSDERSTFGQHSEIVLTNRREQPTASERKVMRFLEQNPEALNWSRSQLGDAVGVAKSTASTGARWYLSELEEHMVRPQSTNGNGHHIEN